MTEPVMEPGYPEPESFAVRRCLQTIRTEEWEHRLQPNGTSNARVPVVLTRKDAYDGATRQTGSSSLRVIMMWQVGVDGSCVRPFAARRMRAS